MSDFDTIVALATPQGVGALAVIRVSGKKAFESTNRIIREKEKFKKQKEREIGLYTITDSKNIIDHVTVIKYKNPKSYTGEDLIEIIAHGGKYTIENIIKALQKNGVKIAQRGEFSKRAFLNGKISLIRAESIKDIIESNSEEQYRKAILSYFNQGKKIETWKKKIETEITYIEAEIEFSEEEEVEKRNNQEVKKIKEEIKNEIERAKRIKKNMDGINIVIAGPSNAGKYSIICLGQIER